MSANDSGSVVNTKSGALSIIAICLIVLVTLTVYKYWLLLNEPYQYRFSVQGLPGTPDGEESYGVERPIGFFITALVMTGILPFVWWAFRRFQWSKASGPLLLWVVLIFCFCTVHLSTM